MSRSDQSRDIEEQSVLIPSPGPDEADKVLESSSVQPLNKDVSTTESKSVWYLFLLTVSVGGLQIVWSVEFSNGSPYLLSLGMSKALMAIIWLAGPMTGVLVQPYVGILSDRSQISWGRRRPFMVAGTLGTVVTSLLLAYAKEIVWVLAPWSDDQKYEGARKGVTIGFAAVMMWCLDFSVNTVQAAIRAFIVDSAPAHQQESANAWASRATGVGSVLGYLSGYLDLPQYFSKLGNSQFKALCVIASVALSLTVFLSCVTIPEQNPQDDPIPTDDNKSSGLVAFFKQVIHSIKSLSPIVRSVCKIQLCHWLGWFPVLFYTTTYIGQLYVDPRLRPDMTEAEIDELWTQATRVGTLALLVFAIVSFVSNIVLPFLVTKAYKAPIVAIQDEAARPGPSSSTTDSRRRDGSRSLLQPNLDDGYISEQDPTRQPALRRHLLERLQIPGLTLRRTWMLSQILHALCMFSTFFISSTVLGSIMIGLVGITWSLTLWAPFAFISADIAKRHERQKIMQRPRLLNGDEPAAAEPADEELEKLEREENRAGIILGLHNVAVSAPQVVASLISSIIFKILQKDRSTPGDTSVAWTLRLGGVAALGAAFLTWRMSDADGDSDEK